MGLAFEITHPGMFAPGVIGAVCLLMALYGMQVLPVSVAGVALIVLSMILFALEAVYPTHGVLAVGGVVSIILGGMLLFHRNSGLSVSRIEIGLVAAAFAAFSCSSCARRSPRADARSPPEPS